MLASELSGSRWVATGYRSKDVRVGLVVDVAAKVATYPQQIDHRLSAAWCKTVKKVCKDLVVRRNDDAAMKDDVRIDELFYARSVRLSIGCGISNCA